VNVNVVVDGDGDGDVLGERVKTSLTLLGP